MVTLSVKAKLLLIIVGITTACLGVSFAFVILNDVKTFRRELVDSGRLWAQVVAEYSVGDLAFGDRTAAAETLDKLRAVPAIEGALVYDEAGRVFSVYGDVPGRPPPHRPDAAEVSLEGPVLHVRQPAVYHGKTYGTVYLRISTEGLRQKVMRHALLMGLTLLGVLAMGSLAALRLQRIVSSPIVRLSETARKITETGDYGIRVTRTDRDEVGRLCESLNDMLDQIQQREVERDQAELRTREKSQFLASMSHELRTPLNSIIGFATVLLTRMSDRLPPRGVKFLENIQASGQHLLRIINDILDLSKVEAGKMQIEPELVTVVDIVEGACAVMRGALEKRQVTIDLDLTPGLPRFQADPVKLKQVLYNLLSNAVKFSPEGSRVRVTGRRLPASESPLQVETIALAVIDEGIGIAPENQLRVFEPFVQEDGSTSRRYGGTGLGLSLVKAMVELHRGRVTLSSVLGQGSTFTVLLPRDLRAVTFPSGDSGSAHRRVLAISRRHSVLRPLSRELVAAGFEFAAAADADETLALLRSFKPAVLLADLEPPRLAGWDVVCQVKAHPRAAGLPVVLLAGATATASTVVLAAQDLIIRPAGLPRLLTLLTRAAPPSGSEAARVLVVSDDQELQRWAEARLPETGLRVDQARTAEEGLARAATGAPQLLVVDLAMDAMGGFETALRLRARPQTASIPQLLLAGASLDAQQRHALAGRLSRLTGELATPVAIHQVLQDLLTTRT